MDNLSFSSVNISTVGAKFPSELKKGFFRSFDKRFTIIFSLCFIVLFISFFIGSLQKMPEQATSDEVEIIQERYAKLVLNKELPKPEKIEEKKEEDTFKKEKEQQEEKKEVKRKSESVEQRKKRKAATKQQRVQKRKAMKKQIENIGVFAELTASGGSGASSSQVEDLIGNTDATSSLSGLDVSQSSFIRKKASKLTSRRRRGQKTEGGSLEKSQLASARARKFSSKGEVDLSKVQNVQGEASSDASRSIRSIQLVLRKYEPRLRRVYERYLKRNPDLSGKIVIKLTIGANGSVISAKIISSELNDPSLEKALVRRIKRIRFPAASGKTSIEWPLVFTAG